MATEATWFSDTQPGVTPFEASQGSIHGFERPGDFAAVLAAARSALTAWGQKAGETDETSVPRSKGGSQAN